MDFKLNTKIAKRIWFFFGKTFLSFLVIVGIFFFPTVSHAGIWSSVMDFFSGPNVSAQSETIIEGSSQTMTLPEPAINSDPTIKVGGEVTIDGGEALLPEVGPSTDAPDKIDNSNGQISIYTVRSGDTLAKVADMFDVSVNTILWANDMTKGTALKVGQTLVILPISGVLHTVASGDTLNTIAKKYGGDVNEIASFNDLKITDKLVVGDTIVIPDGQVSSSIRPSVASNSSASRLITSGGPAISGYYMKPFIDGPKTHRTQGLHGYNGVDYGMPTGTPIYASAAGSVIISKYSGYNGGYGNYVVIQHPNNTQTVYGHLSSPVVSVGQSVTKGQLIGYSGNSGKSTGPHLHFEIRGAQNPF